jgi:hypothetical protein
MHISGFDLLPHPLFDSTRLNLKYHQLEIPQLFQEEKKITN